MGKLNLWRKQKLIFIHFFKYEISGLFFFGFNNDVIFMIYNSTTVKNGNLSFLKTQFKIFVTESYH